MYLFILYIYPYRNSSKGSMKNLPYLLPASFTSLNPQSIADVQMFLQAFSSFSETNLRDIQISMLFMCDSKQPYLETPTKIPGSTKATKKGQSLTAKQVLKPNTTHQHTTKYMMFMHFHIYLTHAQLMKSKKTLPKLPFGNI